MERPLHIRSDICHSTPTKVVVKGFDLCADLLGKVSIGDMAFLGMMDRLPDERESVMFNALMVSLAEHGITPSSLATRMTIAGAPEAMQAAVAAGLAGLGSRFVGSMEDAARMLQDHYPFGTDFDPAEAAQTIVSTYSAGNRQIPGIGHSLHKPRDPRADRLLEIAKAQGFSGPYTQAMTAVAEIAAQRSGKIIPLNATGAIAAIALEMRIPVALIRGIGVAARAVGLLSHIKEELEHPIALKIKAYAGEAASGPAETP